MMNKPNGTQFYLSLFFSVSTLMSALAFSEESVNNNEKLSTIKQQIDSLQAWLKDARNEHDGLYQSIKASEKSISELEAQTSSVSDKVKVRENKLAELEKEELKLKQKIKDSQLIIENHIRDYYLLSKQESLKLLLNAEDPSKLSRLLTYYDYINQAHSQQINEFKQDIEKLNVLQKTMATEKTELQAQVTALHEKQKILDQERSARNALMAELDARINSKDAELKKLLQDRAQLEKIIASVSKTTTTAYVPSSDTSPFASWKGKLPWPLAGKVLHRFGEARVQNKVTWEGLTLGVGEGTPVRAVYHGRVVFADSLRGFGLLVIIDHGNNYMSLYAHNQKTLKAVGTNVKSGDEIAISGSSDSTEPALYFEIRQNGKPQNPGEWLSKKP
jgi:septal ring factor EnvC (AmiA/AmiB activator)